MEAYVKQEEYSTILKDLGFQKIKQLPKLAKSQGHFGYVHPDGFTIKSTFAYDENGGCWVLHDTLDLAEHGFTEDAELTANATAAAEIVLSESTIQ